ncbi:MAG: SBBP repeat-containing protein, partial [Acidobacteriota bacterium]
DFVVDPGADPSLIRLEFVDGAGRRERGLAITTGGELQVGPPNQLLRLLRPVIYQAGESGREMVGGEYVVAPDALVEISLAGYDRTRQLVIDPLIQFSSLLGGAGQETPYAMTIDQVGNIYIAGQTSSTNFPIRAGYDNSINGTSDAFIIKINPSGSAILAATFLGGRNPGDRALDIKLDRDGFVYVCGETSSLNFPIKQGFQNTYRGNTDGFISIFNNNLNQLMFSSYLGGSSFDSITRLAISPDQQIYLTGGTRSTNFPIVDAMQPVLQGRMDAFVTKIDPLGSIVFSTYLGGPDMGLEVSEDETGYGIVLDTLQNVYVTGVTSSRNFPLVNAIQPRFGGVEDGFVVKMRSDGRALLYSTYLGGERADRGRAIAVDSFGQAIITGYTFFGDFPTANAFQPVYRGNLDAFGTKLSATGREFIFSTFLGGSGEENSGTINDQIPAGSVAVDRIGNVYVAGKTSSADFPV